MPPPYVFQRSAPTQVGCFLQTGQKSVGGWFSAGNQREGGFLPSLTETLPLHQQPWEAFTAVLYSWGHFSRQNLPDRPGSDAAGRFSALSPQCVVEPNTSAACSSGEKVQNISPGFGPLKGGGGWGSPILLTFFHQDFCLTCDNILIILYKSKQDEWRWNEVASLFHNGVKPSHLM